MILIYIILIIFLLVTEADIHLVFCSKKVDILSYVEILIGACYRISVQVVTVADSRLKRSLHPFFNFVGCPGT